MTVLALTSIFIVVGILQKITKEEESLDLGCAKLGMLARSDFESKHTREEGFLNNVSYHYNARLKKCLFGREIHSGGGKGESFNVWKGITDLSSNKEILYSLRFYSSDTPPKMIGEFSAINYLDSQSGVVIKGEAEFESLYNRALEE